ncbi:MAG: M28 family peptidase [Candidatus Lokiarchaeota archaeon]|nr:M28 family peptidase [Candidatus Lokiarchaeota archaeon]
MVAWLQNNPKININSVGFIIFFLLTCGAILITAPNIQNSKITLSFNGNEALNHVSVQISLNTTHYRTPGTKGRQDCANYFVNEFQDISLNITQIFHNFSVNSISCQNVLFKMNENKNNIVILAAHYDSRAKATKDPDLNLRNNPIPGANDGASGCAVLLELAERLYQRLNTLGCQLWFLFFDAEDQGEDSGGYGLNGWDWCEGSNKFVEDLSLFYDSTEETFECMILLDMVGGTNLQFIAEQYSTSSLLDELFEIGRQLGYTYQFPLLRTSSSITDDHIAFIDRGIPSADLIINFWDNPLWPYHHTLNDDINSISSYSLEVTGKTLEQFIYNNYLIPESLKYSSNAPWLFDMNAMDSTIVILLLVMGFILALLGLGSYLIKQRKDKKSQVQIDSSTKKA